MSSCRTSRDIKWGRRVRIALVVACAALATPMIAQTLPPDLCGCRDHPSLGAFDTRNSSTWPPGTNVTGAIMTIPLPADGVLVFDSMHLEWANPPLPNTGLIEVAFQRNAANTPVTILVKGDVLIAGNADLSVKGANGGSTERRTRSASAGLEGPADFVAAMARSVSRTS